MTHWRTKKILAIARAAKVAKAQREIMQNGNNIIKRGRGRPPRKVQMNGGGGQVDYNNAARKYVYVRSPTKPDPTVVTRRQIKSEGTDPNDVGHFLSTPTQRGKRLYHFGSTQQIRRKLAKNQNEAEMAQSTSKRQLYKNPHFPSQSTPSVTTRRNRQQQMHQSGNGNIASSSTHLRGKKLRRQKCPPPRFTPTWRAKRGGLRVPRVEVDYAETTGEEEEENNYEEEEEEDPVSEIDLLCRSHSSDSGSSNDSKMSNSNESTENSTKLTKMDQKMIAKNKFAKQQMEVAIDNGQLDRAVRQILRTRSEEMVPDARPQSSILFQPSPCFALASCLPEFERISAQLGLELRKECDSFVFLGLDSPIPALVGSLLCFSESADNNSICVDEFRQLQLAGTFEWSKAGKAQFLDAVFGRCVQFFAIPVEKFNTNE